MSVTFTKKSLNDYTPYAGLEDEHCRCRVLGETVCHYESGISSCDILLEKSKEGNGLRMYTSDDDIVVSPS